MKYRDPDKLDPRIQADPDLRESKRRLSGWADDSDPQMCKINAINREFRSRVNAQRPRR